MNSAISLLGRSPTPTASRSRSSSYVGIDLLNGGNTGSGETKSRGTPDDGVSTEKQQDGAMDFTEESPLLGSAASQKPFGDVTTGGWASYPQRISSGIVGSVRVVLTTVTAPLRYVIACFYDEDGHFSLVYPIISLGRALNPRKRRRGIEIESLDPSSEEKHASREKTRTSRRSSRASNTPIAASTSAVYSDSELDEKSNTNRHTRTVSTSSSTSGDEIAPQRRSIRIKLHNEEALKKRRVQQASDAASRTKVSDAKDLVAASLKSPSSPLASSSLKLTKFPRAPQPPRPLIPRRQPSYSKPSPGDLKPRQKTLVIDLDETLIHSQSKGGRFANGHMIEVKMNLSVGVGGVTLGPQVPILYYVHKRPHCDEFLRKVCSSPSCPPTCTRV